MARQLRLEFPGALYHLTARGNAGQAIFADDQDRLRFLDMLAKEIAQQRWRCYAYCLMDDHYLLLIETPEPNLSRGMRRLNGLYTQSFNRRHHRGGHVFQGRFKSILIDKESYLREIARDIVLNPVRTQRVRTPEAWPWSSYAATVGRQPAPAWLAVGDVLELFARNVGTAQRAYQRFVRDGIRGSSPWEEVRGQIFLGSESFLKRMAKLLRGKPVANVPLAQTLPMRPTVKQVLQHVQAVYGVSPKTLFRRTDAEAYHCAAWLLRRVANEPLKTVADRFGVSPSRISHIQRAFEERPRTQREVQAMKRCKVKL
jgi:putative transposase